MKNPHRIFRQGDVLLVALAAAAALPAGAKQIPFEKRGIVLALGEATGHAHVLQLPRTKAERPTYWDAGAERFVQLLAAQPLKHTNPDGTQADHDPIALAPGLYQQGFQVEYSPEELRNVAD